MNRKRLIRFFSIALSLSLALCIFGCSTEDPEKKTLSSLSKVADGIYIMDCYTDYKVDEYLKAEITDVAGFDTWMTKNLTKGVPTGTISDIGCSSFIVNGTDGEHLFGRNYDMKNGDSLIIRTVPKDGYASIGIVDLRHVNLGTYAEYDINNVQDQPLLFAAPWCICDGINEKGLGTSVLELDQQHVVIDTEKDDLLLYSALRIILDTCANIDEAVALLEKYDMYSPRNNSYHIFLTDTSGRSVIAEWNKDGKLVVIEDTAAANFPLYRDDKTLDYGHRYAKIHRRIDQVDSMTAEEAMGVLEAVNQGTRWSAVYDLDNFTVDVCFNADYSVTYTYSGKPVNSK